MKMHNPTFNRDSEFRLIHRLDRLEANLYKIKRSLLKWLFGIAFIVMGSEEAIYTFLHFH